MIPFIADRDVILQAKAYAEANRITLVELTQIVQGVAAPLSQRGFIVELPQSSPDVTIRYYGSDGEVKAPPFKFLMMYSIEEQPTEDYTDSSWFHHLAICLQESTKKKMPSIFVAQMVSEILGLPEWIKVDTDIDPEGYYWGHVYAKE